MIKNKVVKNDIDMFKNYCAFLFKNSFNKFKINDEEKEILLKLIIFSNLNEEKENNNNE